MIQLTVSGALGRDATAKTLESGKTVINFSIGVSVGYGDKKHTEWVDASYWVDKTGITEYLKKGTKVLCYGEAGVRAYTKQDGTAAAAMTLRVNQVELIGGKQEGQAAPQQQSAPAASSQPANNITEPVDDLPF